MSGQGQTPVTTARGEQRKYLLQDRDDRIGIYIQQQRPIAAIAILEGLPEDYCRKLVKKLAAENGLDYKPNTEVAPVGVTEDSRTLRNNLANILAKFRGAPDRHQLEVARETGLTQSQQILATQRPNNHDWTLGQLERTARATNQDFTLMMLRALLTTEQYEKVRKCLNI